MIQGQCIRLQETAIRKIDAPIACKGNPAPVSNTDVDLQSERQRLAQIPGMANPHEALKEEQMDD